MQQLGKHIISWLIIFCFTLTSSISYEGLVWAQSISAPFSPVMGLSQPMYSITLKGLTVHPDNPFEFEFLVDQGDSIDAPDIKSESTTLIQYFLAALTTPDDQIWVNLSPYESERIITEGFEQTAMGRDMLAQDYLLKKLTSSLMFPESDIGAQFWDQIYAETFEKYGTTEVPIDTFNKVWIVPDVAEVYEYNSTAYLMEKNLKVMLERDYVAEKNYNKNGHNAIQSKNHNKKNIDSSYTPMTVSHEKDDLTSAVMRDIIIPKLQHEVNHGTHFAPLRQMYDALILSTWFKRRLRDSVLGQVYVDQNKTAGVTPNEEEYKQRIYDEYTQLFKEGVFNYIKEEHDQYTNDIIPRKYFAGGTSYDAGIVNIKNINNTSREERVEFSERIDRAQTVTVLTRLANLLTRSSQSKKADFSKTIKENQEQIDEVRALLMKRGVKNRFFKKVGGIQSIDSRYQDIQKEVYEHSNGLRIIRKMMEYDLWFKKRNDVDVVKKLHHANRNSIVPLFFSDEKDVYYELDLRPFGYVDVASKGWLWIDDNRRRKIIDAVWDGLRFDNELWFEHGHLHGANIIIKTNENDMIEDIRIIDFDRLQEVPVNQNPIYAAIRDGNKNPTLVKPIDFLSLDWMDLSGFNFENGINKLVSVFGSILNDTNLSGSSTIDGSSPFNHADLRHMIFQHGKIYGTYFPPKIDLEGVDFLDTNLGGSQTEHSLAYVRNLHLTKNLRQIRGFDFDESASITEVIAQITNRTVPEVEADLAMQSDASSQQQILIRDTQSGQIKRYRNTINLSLSEEATTTLKEIKDLVRRMQNYLPRMEFNINNATIFVSENIGTYGKVFYQEEYFTQPVIAINAEFYRRLTPAQRIFVIAHELGHVLFSGLNMMIRNKVIEGEEQDIILNQIEDSADRLGVYAAIKLMPSISNQELANVFDVTDSVRDHVKQHQTAIEKDEEKHRLFDPHTPKEKRQSLMLSYARRARFNESELMNDIFYNWENEQNLPSPYVYGFTEEIPDRSARAILELEQKFEINEVKRGLSFRLPWRRSADKSMTTENNTDDNNDYFQGFATTIQHISEQLRAANVIDEREVGYLKDAIDAYRQISLGIDPDDNMEFIISMWDILLDRHQQNPHPLIIEVITTMSDFFLMNLEMIDSRLFGHMNFNSVSMVLSREYTYGLLRSLLGKVMDKDGVAFGSIIMSIMQYLDFHHDPDLYQDDGFAQQYRYARYASSALTLLKEQYPLGNEVILDLNLAYADLSQSSFDLVVNANQRNYTINVASNNIKNMKYFLMRAYLRIYLEETGLFLKADPLNTEQSKEYIFYLQEILINHMIEKEIKKHFDQNFEDITDYYSNSNLESMMHTSQEEWKPNFLLVILDNYAQMRVYPNLHASFGYSALEVIGYDRLEEVNRILDDLDMNNMVFDFEESVQTLHAVISGDVPIKIEGNQIYIDSIYLEEYREGMRNALTQISSLYDFDSQWQERQQQLLDEAYSLSARIYTLANNKSIKEKNKNLFVFDRETVARDEFDDEIIKPNNIEKRFFSDQQKIIRVDNKLTFGEIYGLDIAYNLVGFLQLVQEHKYLLALERWLQGEGEHPDNAMQSLSEEINFNMMMIDFDNPDAAMTTEAQSHFDQVKLINTAIQQDNKTNGVAWDYWSENRERDDEERIKPAIIRKFNGERDIEAGIIDFVYDGNNIVGYVIYKNVPGAPDQLKLALLAVHPDFQGRGFGVDLTRHVFEEAMRLGKKEVTLNVFQVNEHGVDFYKEIVPKELGDWINGSPNSKELEKRIDEETGHNKTVDQIIYTLDYKKSVDDRSILTDVDGGLSGPVDEDMRVSPMVDEGAFMPIDQFLDEHPDLNPNKEEDGSMIAIQWRRQNIQKVIRMVNLNADYHTDVETATAGIARYKTFLENFSENQQDELSQGALPKLFAGIVAHHHWGPGTNKLINDNDIERVKNIIDRDSNLVVKIFNNEMHIFNKNAFARIVDAHPQAFPEDISLEWVVNYLSDRLKNLGPQYYLRLGLLSGYAPSAVVGHINFLSGRRILTNDVVLFFLGDIFRASALVTPEEKQIVKEFLSTRYPYVLTEEQFNALANRFPTYFISFNGFSDQDVAWSNGLQDIYEQAISNNGLQDLIQVKNQIRKSEEGLKDQTESQQKEMREKYKQGLFRIGIDVDAAMTSLEMIDSDLDDYLADKYTEDSLINKLNLLRNARKSHDFKEALVNNLKNRLNHAADENDAVAMENLLDLLAYLIENPNFFDSYTTDKFIQKVQVFALKAKQWVEFKNQNQEAFYENYKTINDVREDWLLSVTEGRIVRILKDGEDSIRKDGNGNQVSVQVILKEDVLSDKQYVEKYAIPIRQGSEGDLFAQTEKNLVSEYITLKWFKLLGLSVPGAELIRNSDNRLVLRMEYIEGFTLDTLRYQGGLSALSSEQRRMLQLLSLGSLSVMNDDFHQGNIIVGSEQQIFGIDFESSFIIGFDEKQTREIIYELMMKGKNADRYPMFKRIFNFDFKYRLDFLSDQPFVRDAITLAHRIASYPDSILREIVEHGFSYIDTTTDQELSEFLSRWNSVRSMIGYMYDVDLQKINDSDESMVSDVGGIDFNPENLNIRTTGDNAQMIQFNFTPAQIEQMKRDITGFTPVIIHIQPVSNLPFLLGLDEVDQDVRVAQS